MKRRSATLGVLLAGAVLGGCSQSRGEEGAAAYVGRDACRECHTGNFANFAGTGMGRSFYRMRPELSVEDWTENNEFVDEASGLRYRMFERDGRYYQRQYVLDSQGRPLVADEYELTYVVGSNHHSRGYVVVRGDKMFQAPVCWDPTEKFWMYCPGFEYKNDHYAREVSDSCLFCHNGHLEPVAGRRNVFHEPLPMGIGCERCHGPGSIHVEARKTPADPWALEGQPDSTIVNPARLPPERRVQVCFQCHLGDPSATVRVLRHGRSRRDFRPGMALTDVFVPFRYVEQTKSSFSLVSQADRMLLSRCYLESGGALECLTCHNPHITVYQRPPGSFRDNCRTCHELDDCTDAGAARAATSPPDDCVACHMRRAEPNDRKHSVFTDHWIRRDARDTVPDRRTRFELEPIFPDAFAAFPAGERAYYLGRAHFLRALNTGGEARRLHRVRAVAWFEQAIAGDFGVVEAWFYLGKIHMELGRHERALDAFLHVLAQDPAHHDATFAAGQSLAALGRYEEAEARFASMLERDAADGLALSELARMRFVAGRYDEAEALYRRAVDSEPWNAHYRYNLGMSLAALGRMDAAAEEGLRAARLDPDSAEIWDLVRNAAREAGRPQLEREARLRLASP